MNLETNIRLIVNSSSSTTTTTEAPSYIQSSLEWLENLLSSEPDETLQQQQQQPCSYLTYKSRWEECDQSFRLTDHLDKLSTFFKDKCNTTTTSQQDDEGSADDLLMTFKKLLTDPVNRKYFRIGSSLCVLVNSVTISIYLFASFILHILNKRELKKINPLK